jgi:hypothetical protein
MTSYRRFTVMSYEEVPSSWREANVVPLFKKGDKTQAKIIGRLV